MLFRSPDSSSTAVVAAGAVVDETVEWACGACTCINPKDLRARCVCGTARPGGHSPHPPTPWACSVCTLINEATSYVCSVCGTADPAAEARRKQAGGSSATVSMAEQRCPDGHWVCSVEHGGCSKFNLNSAYYCEVCDKGRPNLASIRF